MWIVLSIAIALALGWRAGLSVAMLLPPLFGLGGASVLTPALSAALPVFGFAAVFVLGPGVMGMEVEPVRFEIAGLFVGLMAWSYQMGWGR